MRPEDDPFDGFCPPPLEWREELRDLWEAWKTVWCLFLSWLMRWR